MGAGSLNPWRRIHAFLPSIRLTLGPNSYRSISVSVSSNPFQRMLSRYSRLPRRSGRFLFLVLLIPAVLSAGRLSAAEAARAVEPPATYSMVTDTFAADSSRSCRTTVLLGDPCLREVYLPQVQNLSMQSSGVPVALNWSNQTEATAGSRIYRAASGSPSAWTFLKDVDPGVVTTMGSSPNGAQAYLIKSLAVVSGGFGNFTNSSLGSFAVPSN